MTLIYQRLGNRKWVCYDDANENTQPIIYDKTDIISDIAALRETLAQYPNPDVLALDVQAILTWITANAWPAVRKERVTASVNAMYAFYQQGDQKLLEAAALQARLDALLLLLARLV
jgi:hypothetical protein